VVDELIEQAVQIIKDGGVIAYPTEGVFGLGCDPENQTAVKRILRMKQREMTQGLILVASSTDQVLPVTTMDPIALVQMTSVTWPGATTWVLPATDKIPAWVKGDHQGVAVRVTSHPVAYAITQQLGRPIISTSANPHHMPPATNAEQVQGYFPEHIDLIIPGQVDKNLGPSEIRDSLSGKILRKRT